MPLFLDFIVHPYPAKTTKKGHHLELCPNLFSLYGLCKRWAKQGKKINFYVLSFRSQKLEVGIDLTSPTSFRPLFLASMLIYLD